MANIELWNKKIVIYTWGNVSGRSNDGKYMVIKPSGIEYDKLTWTDMVVVDIASGKRLRHVRKR